MTRPEGPEAALCGQRILVTGATGFLGSHLVRRLVGLGARVHVLVRARSKLDRVADVFDAITILRGDLRVRSDVAAVMAAAQPDVIFHLAAYGVHSSRRNSATIVQTNVLGLIHLLEASRDRPYARLVNTGTCFEYGHQLAPISESTPVDPLNVYAASKVMASHVCNLEVRQHEKPIVTLCPFTFFGPEEARDRLIPSVIAAILDGRPIRITTGTQTRDYLYVEDMADAFLAAAVVPIAAGDLINVGSGEDRSVREIAERVRDILGSTVPIEVGAVPSRRDDARRLCADPAKARKVLGWAPRVTFEDGIRRTADWLQWHTRGSS